MTGVVPLSLIGREPELAQLADLVAAAREGNGGSIIVRGEPGVGKTSLIGAATALATDFQVLRCRGVEAEVELPFGGLHELLRPLNAKVADLAEGQRLALESALAMSAAEPASIVNASMGTLTLLASAAAEEPVLLVVDDVHWMDEATLLVLAFVTARIGHDRLVLLMGSRPFAGDSVVPGGRLDLMPLSPERAAELAERTLQRPGPAGLASAIAEATGGNPLAVIETMRLLGDQLDRFGTVLDEPPPPGQLIERGFAHRLAGLTPEARQALVLVAAALTDSADLLVDAIEVLGLKRDALDDAERSGVIVGQLHRLTFSHPLLRSLVYHSASAATLRDCNAALAKVSPDRDSRAWHAAGATTVADETLAAELADVARDFQTRSGMLAAARAFERAARLSPAPTDRASRLLDAGLHARFAGRTAWAQGLLDEAYVAAGQDASLRIQIESARIPLAGSSGSNAGLIHRALRLADEAIGVNDDIAADALAMACEEGILAGDGEAAIDALTKLDALPPVTDENLAFQVASLRVGAALLFTDQPSWVRQLAIDVASSRLESEALGLTALAIVEPLLRLEEDEWAGRVIEACLRSARAVGDLVALSSALWVDGYRRYRRGDWAGADVALEQAGQLDDMKQLPWQGAMTRALLAVVRGSRGDDTTHTLVEAVEELATANDSQFEPYLSSALGLYALAHADGAGATRHLQAAADWSAAAMWRDPSILPWSADLVDAYVLIGDTERAVKALEYIAGRAAATGNRWATSATARLTGVLADEDDYVAHFEHALKLHEDVQAPFEAARTHLSYGRRLRRSGQRVAAREQLTAAIRVFDRLGAPAWVRQAETELSAAGGTPTSSADAVRLSSQEACVAELVAKGMTNKEVAAQLFLTTKTIEWHLRQIYRKLDIKSRVELANWMNRAAA